MLSTRPTTSAPSAALAPSPPRLLDQVRQELRVRHYALDHLLLETTTRYLAITDLPEATPSEPPQRSTPALRTFWQEITDRFTRKIKGIRLFMSSA